MLRPVPVIYQPEIEVGRSIAKPSEEGGRSVVLIYYAEVYLIYVLLLFNFVRCLLLGLCLAWLIM